MAERRFGFHFLVVDSRIFHAGKLWRSFFGQQTSIISRFRILVLGLWSWKDRMRFSPAHFSSLHVLGAAAGMAGIIAKGAKGENAKIREGAKTCSLRHIRVAVWNERKMWGEKSRYHLARFRASGRGFCDGLGLAAVMPKHSLSRNGEGRARRGWCATFAERKATLRRDDKRRGRLEGGTTNGGGATNEGEH